MSSLSPGGDNVITQGKDLTYYEGITPQLETRAKWSRLSQTFAGCGGSKVSLFVRWWLWQRSCLPSAGSAGRACLGRWGGTASQHHRSSLWGSCAMAEMNAASSAERWRERSDALLPLGEPLLRWGAVAGAKRLLFKSPCIRFSNLGVFVGTLITLLPGYNITN